MLADRLSEWCNINATYLRQIEDDAKTHSLPVFIDIRKALHVSLDDLLRDELGENEISKIHEIEMLWRESLLPKQELLPFMMTDFASLGCIESYTTKAWRSSANVKISRIFCLMINCNTFLVSEMNMHAIWNKCSWTRCY